MEIIKTLIKRGGGGPKKAKSLYSTVNNILSSNDKTTSKHEQLNKL